MDDGFGARAMNAFISENSSSRQLSGSTWWLILAAARWQFGFGVWSLLESTVYISVAGGRARKVDRGFHIMV